jgi:hypothetical protein
MKISTAQYWRMVLLRIVMAVAWFVMVGDVVIPQLHIFFSASGFVVPSDLGCFRENGAWLGMHLSSASSLASQYCPYKYPPPFLFLATPLSWFTTEQDFFIWLFLSAAVFVTACKAIGVSWRYTIIGLMSPPTLLCFVLGESGIFISALLLIAFGLADTAPWIAGMAAGGLVMKPQLALLLPACYLASKNRKAFLAAALSSVVVCILSAAVFGYGVWHEYLGAGLVATHATLAAPWPQRDQHIMVTPYIFFHSMGMGFNLSMALQLVVTLLCMIMTWRLWRGPKSLYRLPITLCLAALATPFACLYDLSALAVVVAVVGGKPFYWFWIFSGFYLVLAVCSFSPGAIVLALLLCFLYEQSRKVVDLKSRLDERKKANFPNVIS